MCILLQLIMKVDRICMSFPLLSDPSNENIWEKMAKHLFHMWDCQLCKKGVRGLLAMIVACKCSKFEMATIIVCFQTIQIWKFFLSVISSLCISLIQVYFGKPIGDDTPLPSSVQFEEYKKFVETYIKLLQKASTRYVSYCKLVWRLWIRITIKIRHW